MRSISPHTMHWLLMITAFLPLAVAFRVSAKEVSVSEREWAASGSGGAFSSAQTIPFVVSGGDVIGASGPITAYLTLDGAYFGGPGAVRLSVDGIAATAQVYSLPAAPSPRPLQLILGDAASAFVANTAGTYTHQLLVEPSGVSVGSLAVGVTNDYTREVGNNCPDGSPGTTKTKTVEYFIGNAPIIAGPQTYAITYSLNDDLTNISSPVVSGYVEAVGLSMGGGNVKLYFNDPVADGVTHSLPSSSAPQQFILLSGNAATLLQHATGGTYTQNFTIDPGAIALANVSLKFVLTYQFHPAKSSCGGFPPTGTYTSPVLDTRASSGVLYNSITWRGALGGPNADQGRVRFQVATAPCSNGATNPPLCSVGSWNFIGGSTCGASDWFDPGGPDTPFDLFRGGCSALLDNNEFYRYKVQLCASDCMNNAQTTPQVSEVFLSWSP